MTSTRRFRSDRATRWTSDPLPPAFEVENLLDVSAAPSPKWIRPENKSLNLVHRRRPGRSRRVPPAWSPGSCGLKTTYALQPAATSTENHQHRSFNAGWLVNDSSASRPAVEPKLETPRLGEALPVISVVERQSVSRRASGLGVIPAPDGRSFSAMPAESVSSPGARNTLFSPEECPPERKLLTNRFACTLRPDIRVVEMAAKRIQESKMLEPGRIC